MGPEVRIVNIRDRDLAKEQDAHRDVIGEDDFDRSHRFAFIMRTLDRAGASLFYQSDDLICRWAENLPRGIESARVIGFTDIGYLPQLPAERLLAAKRKILDGGEAQKLEMPIKIGEDLRWFDIWIDPDHDRSGAVQGVFTALVETTEQKRRELQIKNLLREVSHRSKNLLAIVLSLATQTARNSSSLTGFVSAFSGRLQSIARAQDLVTDRDWQGALFSDLVARQAALFNGEKPLPVFQSGVDAVISPTATLYVGLAIHELLANGVREGRFVSADARVDIVARLLPDEEGDAALAIEWYETGKADLTKGNAADGNIFDELSRKFLETVVPLAVEGDGKIETSSDTLTYRLRIDGRHIS